LRNFLAKIAQLRAKLQREDKASINKVAWTVTVASPYLQAVCLPQILATQVLSGRYGYPTVQQVNFTRDKGGQMWDHSARKGKMYAKLETPSLSNFQLLVITAGTE
jgi:hypothetical protein